MRPHLRLAGLHEVSLDRAGCQGHTHRACKGCLLFGPLAGGTQNKQPVHRPCDPFGEAEDTSSLGSNAHINATTMLTLMLPQKTMKPPPHTHTPDTLRNTQRKGEGVKLPLISHSGHSAQEGQGGGRSSRVSAGRTRPDPRSSPNGTAWSAVASHHPRLSLDGFYPSAPHPHPHPGGFAKTQIC